MQWRPLMNNHEPHFLVLALALAAAGCDAGPDHEVIDAGEVCLTSAEADAPLTLRVTLEDCISACVDNEVETCSIVVDGNTLKLTSEFSYDEADEDEVCIAVCNAQQATCSSASLPAGDYVLEHGDETYPIAIPTTDVPTCL